ncbi:ATP-binding protein [Asticcacaulis sp. EMRT-3]|uniref:sensor histidine kinase n=1 Tax=Asticcacaulis sp. EMRT-3 TaxID=3040349 RepID=UPI0024AF6906|nr:ATP-binding protein [Asticcacaulis sp. EMRT-3]MDI7776150.1 ATP-binding protein [Asticcacaulis sp. EMRT-3]
MRMPWGLSVKHVYLAFFSLISIALCVFSLIIYNQYKVVQNLNEYTRYQYENIRQSKIILMDVVDMETGARGFVLTGDKSFLTPFESAANRLQAEVLSLRNATYYEDNSFAETNAWHDRIDTIQNLLETQISHVRSQGRGTISPTEMNKEKAAMDELRHIVETSIANRLTGLRARIELVKTQKNDLIYTLVIGTVLGIGILLGGTIIIIRLEDENEAIEDENQRGELRFRTVMNGINDGVYEVNFVNETMYMSKELKAMLGYDEDELDEDINVITPMIHPDDVESYFRVRHQYVTRKTADYVNIFRLRHKDGTWRWIMARGVGAWDRFGQIRTLIGTHTDITEQKNREEELRQLNADMEAFTYITSHDMRSPLVNLKGFSHELHIALDEVRALLEPQQKKIAARSWAQLETLLKHDIPESLGFIGNAIDRMDTLTTAILDLSRIGKFGYREEAVDSRAIFEKCLGAQSYEISAKSVEVKIGDMPLLRTDAVALEQIFSNLLDNAVKYLNPERRGVIEVSCHETSRDYIFSLRDNGRGIDPADTERVFNIFRRARNVGDVRGLGIGMAYVKASLRKMAGSIWFDSALDVGTTFYVSLPKKPLASDEEASEPAREAVEA